MTYFVISFYGDTVWGYIANLLAKKDRAKNKARNTLRVDAQSLKSGYKMSCNLACWILLTTK